MKRTHNIHGTQYCLPFITEEGVTATAVELVNGRHDEIVAAARKITPGSFRTRYHPPKPKRVRPGTGDFHPSPGSPGSTVHVKMYDGTYREGCVMFPAPGAGRVWVSLWDGKTPICVTLDSSKEFGERA